VRTAVLIPYGIITVVAAFSWRFAWTPSLGYLPRWLHLNGDPLTAHASSLAIIILAEVWKTTPFMSLLLLAGLALVSQRAPRGGPRGRRDGMAALHECDPAGDEAGHPGRRAVPGSWTPSGSSTNIFILTRDRTPPSRYRSWANDQLFVGLNLGIGSAMSVLIFVMIAIIGFGFIKGFGAAAPGMDTER